MIKMEIHLYGCKLTRARAMGKQVHTSEDYSLDACMHSIVNDPLATTHSHQTHRGWIIPWSGATVKWLFGQTTRYLVERELSTQM